MLLDQNGFLEVPEDPRLRMRLSDVVPFEEIDHKACLLLLGEPGMGKSTVIKELADKPGLTADIIEKKIAIDLRYKREPNTELFEHDDFKLWMNGDCNLRLFVDSLDECAQKDFALRLVGKLQDGPIKNLRLRIACRTAELPSPLEGALRPLWSEKDLVGKYELAPLRKQDVEIAADVDAHGFLAQIKERGVGGLAIKPITLEFLLKQYRRPRGLPQSRWELYREGCQILCEESSRSRNSLNPQRPGASLERLATAARIAAVCMFAQRTAVQCTPNLGDLPDDAIHCDDIADKTEQPEATGMTITADLLRETVGTGLFNARSDDRLGFAHQTYVEFLAALFLLQRKLNADQIAALVMHNEKVVPALSEVAAWIASRNPEFKEKLLTSEPQILLQSDMALADSEEKKKLIDSLLERFERRELIDLDVRHGFKNLAHPGLAAQLEPVIRDRNAFFMKRRAAITMAGACRLATLQPTLADVALDREEDYALRTSALRVVITLQKNGAADGATIDRLRPLAFGECGNDPDDELKGYALLALWSKGATGKRISAQELFSCLTPMQPTGHSYAHLQFLATNPLNLLDETELPEALRWAENVQFSDHEHYKRHDFANDIVRRACQRMHNTTIRTALVKLSWRRFNAYEPVFFPVIGSTDNLILSEIDKKRFVHAFVKETSELKYEYQILKRNELLPQNDITWMLKRLEKARSRRTRKRWSALIREAYRWTPLRIEIVEALFHARTLYRELKEALGPYFLSMDLEDPVTQMLQREWIAHIEAERKREERRNAQSKPMPVAEQIAFCLERIDAGEIRWFWRLGYVLWQDGETMSWEEKPDITTSPGWNNASAEDRERILLAASIYLRRRGPKPSKWLGKQTMYWPGIAGYLALWLLRKEKPASFENVSDRVWKRWVPMIIAYHPALANNEDVATRNALVKRAYEKAPQECLDTMTVLLDADKREEYSSDPSSIFNACWDNDIGRFLLDKAKDPTVGSVLVGILLEQTLKHETPGALQYAESILGLPLPDEAAARTRVIAVGRALFRGSKKDAGWRSIWPILCAEPDFGRELMLEAVRGAGPQPRYLWKTFSVNDLVNVYLWLEKQFPRNEDKDMFSGRGHTVTAQDDMTWAKAEIPMEISERGTWEAVNAIERIGQELPNAEWVARLQAWARQYATQKNWTPLMPQDVIALGQPQDVATNDLRVASVASNHAATIASAPERKSHVNMTTPNSFDVAIICALVAPELEKVKSIGQWQPLPSNPQDPSIYFHTEYKTKQGRTLRVIAAAPTQMGMAASAVLTTKMIWRFRPKLVVMVGIAAGAKNDKQNFGDVLAPNQTFNYNEGKLELHKGKLNLAPDPNPLRISDRLLGQLQHWAAKRADFDTISNKWPLNSQRTRIEIHVGPLGSGAAVVDATEPVQQVVEHWRKLIGIEMEAHGVHLACKSSVTPSPEFLCFKSICDFASDKQDHWQDYAAYTAAEVCHRFITEEWENLHLEA